jgi:hypothetical protein
MPPAGAGAWLVIVQGGSEPGMKQLFVLVNDSEIEMNTLQTGVYDSGCGKNEAALKFLQSLYDEKIVPVCARLNLIRILAFNLHEIRIHAQK